MELRSKYISDYFKSHIWPCFEKEFGQERAHSLKNYKNTLEPFCEYVKKDFLKVTPEDVGRYYAYLEGRVRLGNMSHGSMLTYKKNLRALSCAIERFIKENQLSITYNNYFHNSIQGDVRCISENAWLAESKEITTLISKANTPREMLLLLMLTEGALTATQISKLTWEGFSEKHLWYQYDDKHGFPVSELFHIAWKDYREEMIEAGKEPKGLLFFNRKNNPVNTKNISTLIKRCRMEAGISREITARQLRDYGLVQRFKELWHAGDEADNLATNLDDGQITRMRELYLHFAQSA